MLIKLTSKNGEPVVIDAESVEVIEGQPPEGAFIIGQARESVGTRIVMKSGTSMLVEESLRQVVDLVLKPVLVLD